MLKEDLVYEFDVYKFRISEECGHHVLDISNVISWDYIRMRMTTNELQGLSNKINKYLEDSENDSI